MYRNLILTLFISLFATGLFAQTKDQTKAQKLGLKAIRVMDQGKYARSIKMLHKCMELDPDSWIYPYEIAYAHYHMEDFEMASWILRRLLNHPDINDQVFQMLGNAYDYMDKPDSAIYYYSKGLEYFPESGQLHTELGVLEYRREDYDRAIEHWENGVKVSPAFPSNYYWLGKVLSETNLKVWGLLYGEMFMILEPTSARTQEISQVLYNTYNNAIEFTSDTSATVSLNPETVVGIEALSKEEIELPFEFQFETILTVGAVPDRSLTGKDLDIRSFASIRKRFIENWYHFDFAGNVIFDFHRDMLENGVFDYYNYWLIFMGDAENYSSWFEGNLEDFEKFAEYFNENSPRFDFANSLVRNE